MSTKSQVAGTDMVTPAANVATASPANAWSRPLQSRRPAGPPPGMSLPNANSSINPSASSVMVQNRERLLHLSLTLIGQKVVVEQTDGAVFEGVFHTFTPFNNLSAENKNKYVLKEVRIQRRPRSDNGRSATLKDGDTLVIPSSKVVYVHAKNIDLDRPDRAAGSSSMNGSGGAVSSLSDDAFATDTQISGSRGGRDRDLIAAGSAWTSAASNGPQSFRGQPLNAPLQTNSRAAALGGPKNTNNNNKGPGGVSATGKLSGSIGGWDQFKANEELFNVNASFDENLYTTQLDMDSMDAKRVAEAERIAREIESSVTDNIHMAEERGQKIETDFRDEEDRYSTVLTQDGKQRHEVKAKDTKDGKPAHATSERPKVSPSLSSSGQRKTMNYAAAAAKADPSSKVSPPVVNQITKVNKAEDATVSASAELMAATKDSKTKEGTEKRKLTKKTEQSSDTPQDANASNSGSTKKEDARMNDGEYSVQQKEAPKDQNQTNEGKKDSKSAVVKTSKLNANAKAFTFNPQAKAFTPSFGGAASSSSLAPPQASQPGGTDPNIPMYGGGHPMQHAHYLATTPMGQPGMMPLMNPQYGGMRYQPHYGREQPMQPIQHHQGQPSPGSLTQNPAPTSGSVPPSGSAPTGSNDDDSTPPQDESSPPVQQQRSQSNDQQMPSQQPQMSMPYGVPPGAYFQGTMGMPRPGYPQYVTGPQQMPGRPGVPPYGVFPIQPGGMPPNMQLRGPNGAPYYHGRNGPIPYPPGTYMGHGIVDDGGNDSNYRGRGRGAGGGRGGRGRGRGGRGKGRFNNSHPTSSGNNSGRNTPQNQQQPVQSSHQQEQGNPPSASFSPSDRNEDSERNKKEDDAQD